MLHWQTRDPRRDRRVTHLDVAARGEYARGEDGVTVCLGNCLQPKISAIPKKGTSPGFSRRCAAPMVEAAMFPMIVGQKSLSVSLLASVTTTAKMLDFCDRH